MRGEEITSPGFRTGELLEESFLSIDVDAQLKKLPSHTFRSRHEYPVELVRDACRRGAGRIDVTITRRRIDVVDDGKALSDETLLRLATLFDRGEPPSTRQAALEWFMAKKGIGVLAAFAPTPSKVVVESGDARVVVRRRGGPAQLPPADHSLTRVTIHRTGGKPRRERDELKDLCRFAVADIRLDGRRVSRGGEPLGELAAGPLPPVGNVTGAMVWIPPAGDVCRVHLLENGVRWHQSVHTPGRHGLVYEAAVECPAKPPADLRKRIRNTTLRLHFLARRRYDRSVPAVRDRVDELLFGHFQATGDLLLLEDFSPFRVLGSETTLTLGEVKKKQSAGELTALTASDDPSRYATGEGTTLVLTSRQWEFLAEHAEVPLRPPPPVPRPESHLVRLTGTLRRTLRRLVNRIRLSAAPAMDPELLDEDEASLLSLVQVMLDQGRFRLPWVTSTVRTRVIMIDRARRWPSRVVKSREEAVLVLPRRNRQVQSAVAAVSRDRRNIYPVLPMLTHGHDGWDDPFV